MTFSFDILCLLVMPTASTTMTSFVHYVYFFVCRMEMWRVRLWRVRLAVCTPPDCQLVSAAPYVRTVNMKAACWGMVTRTNRIRAHPVYAGWAWEPRAGAGAARHNPDIGEVCCWGKTTHAITNTPLCLLELYFLEFRRKYFLNILFLRYHMDNISVTIQRSHQNSHESIDTW